MQIADQVFQNQLLKKLHLEQATFLKKINKKGTVPYQIGFHERLLCSRRTKPSREFPALHKVKMNDNLNKETQRK